MAAGLIRSFTVACVFLTRLPLRTTEPRESEIGRSLAFFPVVGFGLGVLLASAAWLGRSLPPSLMGVGVVALLAGLTGGLHLDGVADVFDGLSGGHGDRERTLTIMRDSRIGAHGAVALLLVLLTKTLAVGEILHHGAWRALVLFPTIGRWSVVPLIAWFPYVRDVGLGRPFSDQASAADVCWATAVVLVAVFWAGSRLLVPATVALAVALAFAVWMRRRLGGLSGDVYGAAIELAEVAFLVAATCEL
ncbi:MAG TPA: adenosylcobinamide-GDP ribazoletransferase [Candidatus Acidoferrales bacterium]|nr:adenosylcobinamide-GDP ribazoletransferase [Candidatus Acidoferrales bacterium]